MTEQEKLNPLDAFIDLGPPKLLLADRTNLGRWADCPAQARYVDSGLVNTSSDIANSGIEVHKALAAAIADYIASSGVLSPSELVEESLANLRNSRPDVQPDALIAARACLWPWAKFVTGLHPENIIRFQGGRGERTGQLALDLPGVGVRVTSEIDLLHSSPSKQLLCEVDYKSGHKLWTAQEVAQSFQFTMHSLLILSNYPDVEAVEVVIWNTRLNKRTWPVEFTRSRLAEYKARVSTAAMELWRYRDTPPEQCPTWPSTEKCGMCPAAALCPVAGQPIADVAANPQTFVKSMVAIQARLDAMAAAAKAHVKKTGADIVCDTGECYGTQKPKSTRAPPAALYQVAKGGDDE